jgi:hypothetical protein
MQLADVPAAGIIQEIEGEKAAGHFAIRRQ